MSQSFDEKLVLFQHHHVIFSSRRSLNFDKLQIDATRSIKEFGHPSPGVVQPAQRHKKRNDKPSTYATLIAMSSRRVSFSQKLASALASLFISLDRACVKKRKNDNQTQTKTSYQKKFKNYRHFTKLKSAQSTPK